MIGFESPAEGYTTLPLILDDILIESPSSSLVGIWNDSSMTGQVSTPALH